MAEYTMTKTRPLARWLGTALTLLLFLGCAREEPNVISGNRESILYFGNGSEPQSLDPHVITSVTDGIIASALFEGLVRENPHTLEIEPGVAQHWEFSDDRKTITFSLNPAARWSNGEPLTSEDFLWSFKRILTPAMGNQLTFFLFPVVGAEDFATGVTRDFDTVGIRAPDQHTLIIELEFPVPYFLTTLTNYYTFPVHRDTVEAHGNWTDRFSDWTRAENLVGNGPFSVEDWRLHRHVKVKKNPHYWDASNVALNGIVFKSIENIMSEEKMFRVGQLHYTSQVPLAKIPGYRDLPDTPYRESPWLGTYYYMFNIDKPPVDDVRVRKAMAMAVDRQKLIDKLLRGAAIPSAGLVPRDLIPDYEPPGSLEYNPIKARELLADAGYPDGAGFPVLELMYNTSDDHRKVAMAVQQMWKDELGIEVTLANQEWKVYLDTLEERHYQLARMGWIGGQVDPTTFLDTFTTDSEINRTGFSDARYDDIILRLAPAELNRDKRMALLREAETRLIDQVPLIPFYTYKSQHLVQPGVEGVGSNVLDVVNFKHIRLDPAAEPYFYRR